MPKVEVKKVHTFSGHKDCLYTIQYLGNDQFVAAGAEGLISLWNLRDNTKATGLAKVDSSIYSMYFHESENLLIVGENFSGIHLINTESRQEINSLQLPKSAFFNIQLIDENIWVVTSTGELHVIDLEMKIVRSQKLANESARCFVDLTERNEVAIGFSDNSIKIVSKENFEKNWELEGHTNSVFAIAASEDGKMIVSGGRDACLKFWSLDDFSFQESIVAHMYAINSIDFSPNGRYFVTCSMDKTVKVWDYKQRKLIKVIDYARYQGHKTSVNKVVWLSDAEILSCSDDRSIALWNVSITD